jgi:hypothetical protein
MANKSFQNVDFQLETSVFEAVSVFLLERNPGTDIKEASDLFVALNLTP